MRYINLNYRLCVLAFGSLTGNFFSMSTKEFIVYNSESVEQAACRYTPNEYTPTWLPSVSLNTAHTGPPNLLSSCAGCTTLPPEFSTSFSCASTSSTKIMISGRSNPLPLGRISPLIAPTSVGLPCSSAGVVNAHRIPPPCSGVSHPKTSP